MITDTINQVFSKKLYEEFWKELTNGFAIRSHLSPNIFLCNCPEDELRNPLK